MMDDFKPPKPDQPGRPDEGAELQQQTYQGEQSTYDATPEPVRSDETMAMQAAAPQKKSGAKKWLIGGLLLILLAALGAFAYWQWVEAENAKKELSSAESALKAAQTDAKQDVSNTEPNTAVSSNGDAFNAFSTEYGNMLQASVTLTEADEKAIEMAIKDYYKLAALPEGWHVIVAYKDEKADATTGKPVNALVFWPASAQKPAGFFEVSQAKDDSWKYNEQR